MSSNNQTHRSSRWLNRSFNKDSAEDLEDEEEASVEEEDKVANQSSVIPVEYLGTIKGSTLMRSVHTAWQVNIMLKIALS